MTIVATTALPARAHSCTIAAQINVGTDADVSFVVPAERGPSLVWTCASPTVSGCGKSSSSPAGQIIGGAPCCASAEVPFPPSPAQHSLSWDRRAAAGSWRFKIGEVYAAQLVFAGLSPQRSDYVGGEWWQSSALRWLGATLMEDS